MFGFMLRRFGVMLLTMLCLSFVVFVFVNLEPNLRKLAIFQTEMRASDQDLENWLVRNGYRDNFFLRYGRWIGIVPKQPVTDPATGEVVPRFRFCDEPAESTYSGVLQGDFGCSTAYRTTVGERLPEALKATGILMFWVMVVMVPVALIIGVLAGMREGSQLDRSLTFLSIASTATPEYVSGVIFSAIFASWLGWLNGSAATAITK
nr:ABC transporter permease [Denitromonas sp.]